jgi:hypothetical protein
MVLAFFVIAIALALTYRHLAPADSISLWSGFAMPLLIGIAIRPMLVVISTIATKWLALATGTAPRGLLLEMTTWMAPVPVVIAILYLLSLLSALQFAILLLGIAAASALGLRGFSLRSQQSAVVPTPSRP